MQRGLDKPSVAPMPGFTVAGCGGFTFVVGLGNDTELIDEGCRGEAVEVVTEVIETDPPGQPLELPYWRRSLALYESGRLEQAVNDGPAQMDLTRDNPDFLPADVSNSAHSVDIRCVGSHVARHSALSLLPGPRAASAGGAKAGRRDEP